MIFLLNLQESSGIFSKANLRSNNIPAEVVERSSLVRWPDDDDDDDQDDVVVVEGEDDRDFIGPENRRIDSSSPALINTFF